MRRSTHSIEPYCALAYSQRMLDERTIRVLNPRLVREAAALGVWNPRAGQVLGPAEAGVVQCPECTIGPAAPISLA